jgi:hypothetical protein
LKDRLFKLGFALIFLFTSFAASAFERTLYFPNGMQSPNYNAEMQNVRSGDVLSLGDRKYPIGNLLGTGNTTRIFDMGGNYALRLPKASGIFRGSSTYQIYIQEMFNGYRILKDNGVRVVKVYSEFSNPSRYLVVKKVFTLFSLGEFAGGQVYLNEVQRNQINAALLIWVAGASKFKHIGDFHADQLRWTGTEWILMDWISGSQLAVNQYEPTIFDNVVGIDGYKAWLIQNTRSFRQVQGCGQNLMRRAG